MLRYCSTRWLYVEKPVVRVMEQLDNIKQYFLTVLPTKSGFKGKTGVGSTERYKRIKTKLEDDILLPAMSFIVFAAQTFKPFMLLFQREEPMVHLSYPEMKKLILTLLGNFLVETKLKELSESVVTMLEYADKVDKKENMRAQPSMGTKTIELLNKNVKDKLVKKSFVTEIVTKFYTESSYNLMKSLPLNKQVIYDVQYLHPMLRSEKIIEKPLKRLAGTIGKCLGESLHDIFELDKSCTVEDFQDMIKSEIDFFRMETIPDSMIYLDKPKVKVTPTTQQKSCWKDAFDVVAGVRTENAEDTDLVYRPADSWLDVLAMKDCQWQTQIPKSCKISPVWIGVAPWQC